MLGRIEWRCVRTQKLGRSSVRPITTGIAQRGWGTGADGIQTLSCNAPKSWVDRMRDQSLCRPRRTGILVMLNNHAGAGQPLYMHYDASSPEKPTCFQFPSRYSDSRTVYSGACKKHVLVAWDGTRRPYTQLHRCPLFETFETR